MCVYIKSTYYRLLFFVAAKVCFVNLIFDANTYNNLNVVK